LFNSIGQPDVIVACMGLTPLMEGEEGDAIASTEEGDRSDLTLPSSQVEFIRRLASSGARIVLVLTGGGPIALGDLADLVDAILFVWYPGQEGGHAVADILFGHSVPSGKLPLTFPQSIDQLPPIDDYRMEGRTYRYMTLDPLYPFGFGLSYTHFAYSDLRTTTPTIQMGQPVSIQITVSNVGQVEGDEVVQCYLSDLEASTSIPIHKLVGFQRITLTPGERRMLSFTIIPEMMMLVDSDGQANLEPGQFRVTVGGCSPGPRGIALGAPQPVSTLFMVQ
jgi:beta-glucosidase